MLYNCQQEKHTDNAFYAVITTQVAGLGPKSSLLSRDMDCSIQAAQLSTALTALSLKHREAPEQLQSTNTNTAGLRSQLLVADVPRWVWLNLLADCHGQTTAWTIPRQRARTPRQDSCLSREPCHRWPCLGATLPHPQVQAGVTQQPCMHCHLCIRCTQIGVQGRVKVHTHGQ